MSTTKYPSGHSPLPIPTGHKRVVFDDFTSTKWSSAWSSPYNGESQAASPGYFIGSHSVLKGDSWLRLEAYPDPKNIVNCWQYDPNIANSVNQWGGAGVQTVTRWPVGTIFTWAMKWDTYPGITPIVLSMGNNWPPEQDFIEANVNSRGASVYSYTSSYHYNQGNQQVQIKIADKGISLNKSHIWRVRWEKTETILTCDEIIVGRVHFTPEMNSPTDQYSLAQDQFLAFQIQTGDPNNPKADSTVTSEKPITMFVDWITIDVPIG